MVCGECKKEPTFIKCSHCIREICIYCFILNYSMLHWHYEREDEYIHHIYVIIIIYDDKLDYKSLGMIGGPKSPDLSQII